MHSTSLRISPCFVLRIHRGGTGKKIGGMRTGGGDGDQRRAVGRATDYEKKGGYLCSSTSILGVYIYLGVRFLAVVDNKKNARRSFVTLNKKMYHGGRFILKPRVFTRLRSGM